jgi:hypothetical protein
MKHEQQKEQPYLAAGDGLAAPESRPSPFDVINSNVMLKIGGKSRRCHCGANVFSKLRGPFHGGTERYECNGCGELYETEALK